MLNCIGSVASIISLILSIASLLYAIQVNIQTGTLIDSAISLIENSEDADVIRDSKGRVKGITRHIKVQDSPSMGLSADPPEVVATRNE